MEIYRIAEYKEVRVEWWDSLGSYILLDNTKVIDRNLRPLGKATELGLGIDVFEFDTEEDARDFVIEQGWVIV